MVCCLVQTCNVPGAPSTTTTVLTSELGRSMGAHMYSVVWLFMVGLIPRLLSYCLVLFYSSILLVYTVIYCAILWYTVVYCDILWYTVVYCVYHSILQYIVVYCDMQVYCGMVRYRVVYCGILCYTVVYCGILCYTVVYCGILCYTVV